jgi:putative isomerase
MKICNVRLIYALLTLFITSGCKKSINPELTVNPELMIYDFPNVLDVQGVPEGPNDLSKYCYSDLGTWHGYALPETSDTSLFGGFIGPFLMSQNCWLSRCLAKLTLYDVVNEREVKLSQCKKPEITYLPGLLIQKIRINNISIKLETCFVSSRSSLIAAEISNLSQEPLRLQLGWKGDVFHEKAFITSSSEGILVKFKEGEECIKTFFPPDVKTKTVISNDEKSYRAEYKESYTIFPSDSLKTYILQSACFNLKELEAESKIASEVFQDPTAFFMRSKERWNEYLNKIITKTDRAFQNIAVKCLETLITNWRSPAGDLKFSGLYPSYQQFHGFWAWDSWKHAVALALFAPKLAKDQIHTMFAYQDSYGMIPDVIRLNKSCNNLRNTKPPLAAWAVWSVYEQTKDREFLAEMYPQLVEYHHWWYVHRDHDQDGLCEYGSTDGSLVAAAWESGMDNAARFDNATIHQNDSHSWSTDHESVDLNAYLYAEKRYLSLMAKVLGNIKDGDNFTREAEALKLLIQNCMFDSETGYFYDIRSFGKGLCKIQGPEGWIPLWAGVATKEQAERVKQIMLNPSKFNTYIPFPTLAADHPKFTPTYDGYWRGPVWLDQAYFAIKGLAYYGYKKEAMDFTYKLFNRLEGLENSTQPIYENYDPLNGNGLNAPHFSWSAAHLLLLLIEYHQSFSFP